MTVISFRLTIIGLLTLAILACGEPSETSGPNQPGNTPTPVPTPVGETEAQPGTAEVKQSIALYLAGRKNEAMALLLDGTAPASPALIPEFLNMSETDLQQLPREEALALMKKLPKPSDEVLTFAKAAKQFVSETADATEKQKKANRLKQFGKELESKDYLAVFNMIAASIGRWDL